LLNSGLGYLLELTELRKLSVILLGE